jgi:2-aminoadipate transaminase
MGAMAETADVVKGLFSAMGDKELISFGGGAPAKEVLPVDIVREISNDIMRIDSRGIEALQYGPVMGIKDLREVIANQLLAPKGVKTDIDHIMITTGGLEAISLTCQLFIDPDDIILVESPTFVHAVETFELFEARCIGVNMDEDGMDVDDLEDKIKKYSPKMIYVIPTFQNPTGRTLSQERRMKIAELATI